MKYQWINQQEGKMKVAEICEALGVRRSSYYSWRKREPSLRSQKDQSDKQAIEKIYEKAKGRYGHRPIYKHLTEQALGCGRDRTLRLMKQAGIAGAQKKRYKPIGTDSKHRFGYSPNLLKRFGQPEKRDQIWVADTTYFKVGQQWMYLATVMDLYSRRILGWSISEKNDSALVSQALATAALTRGSEMPKAIIGHSDRGSTYASDKYQRLLESLDMKSSMSAKGNCYDNAAMESFYGRYKTSSVRGHVFKDEGELRANVFEYIEVFYNRFRKHSSLDYENPVAFEEKNLSPMGDKKARQMSCSHKN